MPGFLWLDAGWILPSAQSLEILLKLCKQPIKKCSMTKTQYVTYGEMNNNQMPIKWKIVDSFLEPARFRSARYE